MLLARGGLLCLEQCLGGFYGSKNIDMNTRTRGFLLKCCAVAKINVIHLIWRWF